MRDEAARAFAELMQRNRPLSTLNLLDTGVSEAGKQALLAGLKRCGTGQPRPLLTTTRASALLLLPRATPHFLSRRPARRACPPPRTQCPSASLSPWA